MFAPPRPCDGRRFAGMTIGLFGGSFNPAHAGHRAAALTALKRLRLQRIWWLVSPQNPLKPLAGMAPLATRIAGARRIIAGHPRMAASDLEARLGTRRTVDLADALRHRFHRTRFVLLLGADNLAQLPRWHRWRRLTGQMRLAVLPRSPYSLKSLSGGAARVLRHDRRAPRCLLRHDPPAWSWLPMKLNPLSSTRLRSATQSESVPSPPPPTPHKTQRSPPS